MPAVRASTGFVAAVLLALSSCRWPDLPISRSQTGTVYDTRYEKTLAGDKTHPLLKGWQDDAPLYAEPVAIIDWRDGLSTWKVHFATNRGAAPESPGDGRLYFGNEPVAHPVYGKAVLSLPRSRRGVDPKIERSGVARMSATDGDRSQSLESARLDSVEPLDGDAFLSGVGAQVRRSRQKDLLLFVHGFNVDFDACLVRTAQIALDMPFNGAVVAYSWPTRGGVRNYSQDEPVNAESAAPFLEFLTDLRGGLPEESKIHIVVHSMGNRIVLKALSQLPPPVGMPPIDNLALFAPDVGLGDFRAWAPAAAAQCRRVTLYSSRHDAALISSKGLHAEQRAGDAHPPIVMAGVQTVDCSAIDATSFLGHGYYSGNVDVLSDLFMTIKRDRDADRRPHLKQKSTRSGHYWRWTATAPHDYWTWNFDEIAASREAQRN